MGCKVLDFLAWSLSWFAQDMHHYKDWSPNFVCYLIKLFAVIFNALGLYHLIIIKFYADLSYEVSGWNDT